jgi:hypothetical protein
MFVRARMRAGNEMARPANGDQKSSNAKGPLAGPFLELATIRLQGIGASFKRTLAGCTSQG